MADAANSCVLPASPNWYCSAIADCSLTGKYAFGARNCVYLLGLTSETPAFEGQLVGHSERVTAVCFCKHKLHANFVASGADDKTVKIWDVETKLALMEHKGHSAKVTSLTWSPLAADLVVSGDEKGHIIAWRYAEGMMFGSCPAQEQIFTMALSYVLEGELAVGYKSGLVLVLALESDGKISIVHRLRGHAGEIHSLSWCPVPDRHIDFGPLGEKAATAEGHILLSGSRDQTVRLWDTMHGKALSIQQMPKRVAQKGRERYYAHGAKDRLWLSVYWPPASPGHIIFSTHSGELVLWDLSKEGGEQHQSFGFGHSRIVFNISCDVGGTRIITCSMDRQIIIWDPEFLRSLHTLPTLGGFAYCLGISPLDPGTVAVGVGDNMIRVWQTASSVSPYEAVTLWQGINSKVMVVEWHPTKEGLLAFGADDGQVGIYNVISKKMDSSVTYHKKTVYSLSWGPPCPSSGSDALNLYSCGGEGGVLQHNAGHLMDDAVDVNALIMKTNNLKHRPFGRADVAWNLDGTVMALGNEDGSIEVFVPPDLRHVCSIITHKKSITTLAWHHGYKELPLAAGDISCEYWLASGSNESIIHVHDIGVALQKGGSSSADHQVTTLTSSFRQLSGHWGRVTGLCWSPHQSEFLLSSSYDGTAQVWDVNRGQPLHNFRGHSSRVMSVVWSYLDPDLVYSGGEDGTVRPWRPSLQQHHQPPDKKNAHSVSKSSKTKKSKHKAKGKADSPDKEPWRQQCETKQEPNEATNSPMAGSPGDLTHEVLGPRSLSHTTDRRPELDTAVKGKKDDVESQDMISAEEEAEERVKEDDHKPSIIEAVLEDKATEANEFSKQKQLLVSHVEPFTPLRSRVSLEIVSSKKKRKVKSMFPLSAVADNKSKALTQEECIILAKMLHGEEIAAPSGELLNLGLFGDRRSTYKMFAAEGQHHKESSNLDYRLQLEVWKGNLGGALQMAINSGQLSDWLVALSPLAGHNVWMTTTRAFADQLVSQGSYQRAVLYYLACHDIYTAIDVFRKQAMYREAIALAKVRLSPLDPLIFELYCAWARKLETENSFEQAAKCYLAVNSSSEAVRVLFRRGDEPSLRTAFQVATISAETELTVSLALRLTHSCLTKSNWKEGHTVLTNCSGVEAHILNLCVHELLVVTLYEARIVDEDLCQDVSKTEISSFLNNDTNANELFAKYSDVDFPYTNSPWLLNSEPKKWFVVCVLEAWHHCGVFKPDFPRPTVLYQTLKSYFESISSGTDTIPEVLCKISYELTLGLFSVLSGNHYTACQYWLQALSQCGKNCLFALQRQLCALLLPRGIESLDSFHAIRRGLGVTEEPVDPVLHVSAGQLFRYFYAYYCKALLVETWYRCPDVVKSSPYVRGISSASGGCNQKLLDVAEAATLEDDSLPRLDPTNPESSSAVRVEMDHSTRLADCRISKTDPDMTANFIGAHGTHRMKSDQTETAVNSGRHQEWKSSLYSILLNFTIVLLSHSRVRISNLREALTEIRKAIFFKRSRQMLQEASAVSHLNPGKKKDRKNTKAAAFTALPSGITGRVQESVERIGSSGKVALDDCLGTPEKHEDFRTETGSYLGEGGTNLGVDAAPTNVINEINGKDVIETRESLESITDDRAALKNQTSPPPELLTLKGEPPVELRYVKFETSLEFLTEEESRVFAELKQFELKDLPFPSPLESAMILAHICACPAGLPAEKHEIHQLGCSVVQWALTRAQTSSEIKGLLRLSRRLRRPSVRERGRIGEQRDNCGTTVEINEAK